MGTRHAGKHAYLSWILNSRKQKQLEKILFAALGRRPDLYGLVLGQGGWITYKALRKALIQEPGLTGLRLAGIKNFFIVTRPERFEWKDEKVRVRPEYQVPKLWEPVEVEPPERLYCAIRPAAIPHVMKHGLGHVSRPRQLVMAAERELAQRIGRIRGPDLLPVSVLAGRAWKAGISFFVSVKECFLADHVPPEFLLLPPLPKGLKKAGKKNPDKKTDKSGKKPQKTQKQHVQDQAGSFVLRPEHLLGMIPPSGADAERMREKGKFERKKRRKRGGRKNRAGTPFGKNTSK